MSTTLSVDLAIIGGGSGGLSVAAGATQMGAKVVLVERHKMGGDCLNTGCVPSKALIAAGEAANAVRHSGRFGVNGHEPAIDFAKVRDHVHGVIASIAPHDSVERFAGLGVEVIQDAARFTGPDTIAAGGRTIKARRFVVATGSHAFVPPIDGIRDVPFLTNETIFDLREAPGHLIVVGAGPIGIELAQAHRRLGAKVTVLEMFMMMPKDDPEAVAVVRTAIGAEGIVLHEGVKVLRSQREGNSIAIVIEKAGREITITGTHLLLAAGRRPNTADLGLEHAGIEHDAKGIKVDQRLRTTNKNVFRNRRCGWRLPVHAHGRLSRGHRDPQRAVQPAGQGEL